MKRISSYRLTLLITSAFCGFLAANGSYASSTTSSSGKTWSPILTLSAGSSSTSDIGQSVYFPSPDPVQFNYYNYSASHYTQTTYVAGGLVGAEFKLNPQYKMDIGFAFYQPGLYTAKGSFVQGPAVIGTGQPDPNVFSQYTYRYKVQTQQMLIESKLLYTFRRVFHPYLDLGLGVSFNTASRYFPDIEPPDTTLTNNFQSHTQKSFSYRFGLGVDYDVTQKIRLGLGYRFVNYGRVSTGTSVIDTGGTNSDGSYNPPVTADNRLTQSHLYANELMFQLSCLLY